MRPGRKSLNHADVLVLGARVDYYLRHMKEATARIKINKLLEAAGWRFFAEGDSPANICLEPNVKIKTTDLDALGDDFEKIASRVQSS